MHAVEALKETFARYGQPDIVNTDQGSQFTANAFTEAVLGRGIRLSMDGKRSWRANVFVERVWRTIKYEEVYLKAYESVSHARRSIGEYINLYNLKRSHSSLADQTPGGTLRDAACDQIGSMITSDAPLKNLRKLSERARPPLPIGLLFNQKAIAILHVRNPMGSLAAPAPGRTGLRIAILRRDRGTRARCNGATPSEKLFGRDLVFGNLFTDGGNDGVQLCEPRLFRLLCQRFGLRLQFAIGSHKCAGMSS